VASLDDVEALVGLVHAAAADLCARHDAGEALPVHDVMPIEENRWRAARYGVEGDMVDAEAERLRPTRELVAGLLERLQPAAHACGADAAIRHAGALLDYDAPREHRRIGVDRGLPALCRMLAERTEAA
jgi:carboxylate-amine ligase